MSPLAQVAQQQQQQKQVFPRHCIPATRLQLLRLGSFLVPPLDLCLLLLAPLTPLLLPPQLLLAVAPASPLVLLVPQQKAIRMQRT